MAKKHCHVQYHYSVSSDGAGIGGSGSGGVSIGDISGGGSIGYGSGCGVLVDTCVQTMPIQLWTWLANYAFHIYSFKNHHLITIICLASIFSSFAKQNCQLANEFNFQH